MKYHFTTPITQQQNTLFKKKNSVIIVKNKHK